MFSDLANKGQYEEAMNPQSMGLALIFNNLNVEVDQRTPGHEAIHQNGVFAGLLKQALEPGMDLRLPENETATEMGGTEPGWLEDFRDQLVSLGVPLKDMSLSHEALPDLKGILVGEGYSESEITGFFEKLLHGKPWHEIKLVELFERLSELKALSDQKSADATLEVSAVPYLEAVLSRLGLDLQEVNRAIEQAREQGGCLNLKSLVRNLKQLLRGLPDGNRFMAEGEAAEDIKGMLARAGIVDKASNIDGPISLERFVRILEQRVASLMPRSLSDTQVENHVNGLLSNVLVNRKQQGGKSSVESLYANKLKVLPDGDSDELFSKMERLVELIGGARGKKWIDPDKATSPHAVREVMMDPGLAQTAIIKQGVRPIPLYVVNQVARQISLSLQRGENRLRLQLKPPQLGVIRIDMDMKNSVLKIGMTTEHSSVKEFLVSSLQELRDSLVQQGVKLERIDIQINYDLGQSMAQARRGQNGFQRQGQGQQGELGVAAGNGDVLGATTPHIIRADALVDLLV
jgi:hypothetical protein